MEALAKIADLMAKFGQYAFGLRDRLLAILAISTKRSDLFRSELAKRQIGELTQIRSDLQAIFFDVSYVANVKDTLLTTGWSQEEWRSSDPEAYEQYQRYKKTSLDLFYKFTDSDYYLFPDWLDRQKVEDFGKVMQHWAPFTIQATAKSHEEKKAYMDAIWRINHEFERALKKKV